MSTLRWNLESGSSYLTQESDDPAVDGKILADNFEAVADRLFGEEYTDADMELILDVCGSNPEPFYCADSTVDELATVVDAYVKRRGGKGWM